MKWQTGRTPEVTLILFETNHGEVLVGDKGVNPDSVMTGFGLRMDDEIKRWVPTKDLLKFIENISDMFARISVLADERHRGGELTAEQREILNICSDAGIGISACIGLTGATGPGEELSKQLLPIEQCPPLATFCSVCEQPQYLSPSGPCCVNGHGGAPPLEEEVNNER